MQQFTVRYFLNLTGTILTLYWHFRHWGDFTRNANGRRTELDNYLIVRRIETDRYFSLYYFTSILTAIQFFRLIVAFRLSRTFGPMAKTLVYMFVDVFKFLGLFFSIFI